MEKFILKRNVTRQECDWLTRDFNKGEIIYEFTGATYGCISFLGKACTLDETGGGEFFEIPTDAIIISRINNHPIK